MSDAPNKAVTQKGGSFKTLLPWLAALFLTVLGAQLWIAWLYGSPMPLWDQWYQAGWIFKPWAEGHLSWGDLIGGHGEHRMVVSRLLDLSLIQINGRWEPLLQMTVNAVIHAAFACGLAFCLWDFFGRQSGWFVCSLLIPFFALPYGGENAIWGINSLYYFVNIFALATLVGLGFGRPGSGCWWMGCAAAVISLFTMASGLLATVAAAAIIGLRAIRNRQLDKRNFISLGICLCVAALGALLSLKADYNASLQAHTFGQFAMALARNLEWPFYNALEMPCLIGLPLLLLLVFYLRPNFAFPRAAELLLGMAFWSVLQSILIAYGRANYGEAVPPSRYMDLLNVFVIASVFSAILLAQSWELHRLRNGLLALVFVGIIFYGLGRISSIVVDFLAQTRVMNLVAEERVQYFLATGNEADLFERPTVPPDPKVTLDILRDPAMQRILPASCLSTAPSSGERLMAPALWLMEHSPGMLTIGLVLFTGLCMRERRRGKPGIDGKNLAVLLSVLIGLGALAFVWSERKVSRQSLEGMLDNQIAFNFQVTGNAKRAAIFHQKAEALKPFVN